MTPLEKARALLDEFVEFADDANVELPSLRQAQYASNDGMVVACASVNMGVGPIAQPPDAYDPTCNPGQVGTFTLILARDCGWESEEDGTDNPDAVTAVAEMMDIDSVLLWDFYVSLLNTVSLYPPMNPDMSYAKDSGLAMSILRFSTGID